MTKSFSMAGWRIAFMVGNAEVVQALAKLKSYLDYGTFQPIQIAATVTMNEASDYPQRGERDLPEPPRCAVRRAGPHRLGHPEAEGHDVRLGADPRAVPRDGLARVRVIPRTGRRGGARRRASGSAQGATRFVRFALIENEQRIDQAVRNLRKALTEAVSASQRAVRVRARRVGVSVHGPPDSQRRRHE